MLDHTRIAIATAIGILLSFGSLGCRGRPSARADRDASMHVVTLPLTPTAPRAPPVVLPREMRFELLSAGERPRTVLRYGGGGGGARELVARAVVTTHQYARGAWSDPVALAPVRDGFAIAPGPAGVFHVRGLAAQVDDAGASAASIAAANAYLARWRALLERTRADVTVDARGRFVDATVVDAARGNERDTRDELVQRWLALAVPLPDEPVGVGARWRVVIALRAGGTVQKQDATYILAAVEGEERTVDVVIDRLGEPQDITVPGAADDDAPAIGDLLGFRRSVTGRVILGSVDPLPLRGTLHAEVTSHARVREGPSLDEQVSEDQASIVIGRSSLPVP